MKVLVSHPGLQHSHQLAWALEETGNLCALWSGIPVRPPNQKPRAAAVWLRARPAPISSARRRHFPAFPILRRLCGVICGPRLAGALNHRIDHAYDRWVARGVRELRPDVVVCYENAALHTFRQAKAIGATCVLDAASIHYRGAQHWLPPDPPWVDRQKDDEIALADAIITCSEFAAATYQAAGVRDDKLFTVPLGADTPNEMAERAGRNETCRFVFAGTLLHRKGVDVLLEAFAAAKACAPLSLTLIGGTPEPNLLKQARAAASVVVKPSMAQAELLREIAICDVLVLPSRFDSFGMVVPEAMAVGVPALVSDRVGAKCIIEAHPDSGWIVPCESGALRDKMIELARSPEKVARASAAATVAARAFTWAEYRTRVANVLQDIYERHRKPA